jgi:hypothetical protein
VLYLYIPISDFSLTFSLKVSVGSLVSVICYDESFGLLEWKNVVRKIFLFALCLMTEKD